MVLVPITIRLARRLGVVDEPGARSSHTIATPRLGGIAVGVGALAGLAVAGALDPAALRSDGAASCDSGSCSARPALLFGSIGLADDLLRGIPVSARLLGQVVVGAAADRALGGQRARPHHLAGRLGRPSPAASPPRRGSSAT